ncbi:MAG: peptide chain release factor N(5)-glutamine methyltransferase [Flavobacteriaceae bacterium]|nr:peptide chain release factor N(5)-glutamine methyltransferase [Flavobacteriaceae bacterium]
MTFKELKIKFQKELHRIYLKEEIDSFFYLLIEHQLNINRIYLALNPTANITPTDTNYFSTAIQQLKQEIPIQYIIGKTEFYGLPFYVDRNVLIPRPETEELVEWIVQEVKSEKLKVKRAKPLTILDIGTGSGCIAISLAKNIQNAEIWVLDISKKALEIAQKNAELNHVNIQFLNDDILKVKKLPTKFDIIVSNPPYIRELEKREIKNNVLQNEPHLALFVEDNNALLFYDKIANIAKGDLAPKGKIYFEINQYLGKETLALLKEKEFNNIELRKDIFGNERMIKANF